MFSKEKRVSRSLFTKVSSKGSSVSTPLFSVRISPATDNRYSVVVSKAVGKSAVVRNTVRRRVYAALRAAPVPKGRICIVYTKKPIASASYRDIADAIQKVFR